MVFNNSQPDTITATKLNALRDDLSAAIGSGGGGVGPPGPTGPAGPAGATGQPAYTLSSASFTIPPIGSTAVMSVADTSWATVGEYVWVQSSPTVSDALQITAKTSTSLTLLNPPTAGMQVSGDTGNVLQIGSDSLIYLPASKVTSTVQGQIYWNPVNGVYWYDDFTGSIFSNWSNATSGGTGNTATCAVSSYGVDATKKVNGVAELSLGTAASNVGGGISRENVNNGTLITGGTKYGLGPLTWKTRLFIQTPLPPTGTSFIFRTGMAQTASGTSPFNFTPTGGSSATDTRQTFTFLYTPDVNSGKWVIECGSASPTRYNTSVTVVADTAYNLQIDINTAWTSVNFSINGTVVQTVTTDIPTTSGTQYASMIRGATSAVNYRSDIDYMMLIYQFTR